MPAVLLECGYLTNSDDRKLLVSENSQERLAEAVSDGVLEYRSHFAAGGFDDTEPPLRREEE
jgi:N-acetylmuramoyl-L-alanine amidase